MWTSKPLNDVLPNVNAVCHYKDEDLQFYQLYPAEGYSLHVPSGDSKQMDEEGNPVLDENGNEIIKPYLSEGGATALSNYDFISNPLGFEAVIKEAE